MFCLFATKNEVLCFTLLVFDDTNIAYGCNACVCYKQLKPLHWHVIKECAIVLLFSDRLYLQMTCGELDKMTTSY